MSAQPLEKIIGPTIESMGFELYGCELKSGHNRSELRVYIDRPQGVSIEDCAEISRRVAAVLDVEDPISNRYDLQVSSPGIDRPLFTALHYQRQLDQRIKLRLRIPRNGQRNYIGCIEAVDGEKIVIALEDEQKLELVIGDIAKAKLISEF